MAADRLLRQHALGDVERVAEHVRRLSRLLGADVPIHPDALRALAVDHPQQTGIDGTRVDPAEVVVVEHPRVGRDEVAEIPADPFIRRVPERPGGGRIDEQQLSVEIVGADQAETVLDQLTVAPLDLAKRLFRAQAGGRGQGELGPARARRRPGASHRGATFGTFHLGDVGKWPAFSTRETDFIPTLRRFRGGCTDRRGGDDQC